MAWAKAHWLTQWCTLSKGIQQGPHTSLDSVYVPFRHPKRLQPKAILLTPSLPSPTLQCLKCCGNSFHVRCFRCSLRSASFLRNILLLQSRASGTNWGHNTAQALGGNSPSLPGSFQRSQNWVQKSASGFFCLFLHQRRLERWLKVTYKLPFCRWMSQM